MRTSHNPSNISHLHRRSDGRQARIAVARQTAEEQNERRLRRMAFVLTAATLVLIINAIVVTSIG